MLLERDNLIGEFETAHAHDSVFYNVMRHWRNDENIQTIALQGTGNLRKFCDVSISETAMIVMVQMSF